MRQFQFAGDLALIMLELWTCVNRLKDYLLLWPSMAAQLSPDSKEEADNKGEGHREKLT